MKTKRPTQEDVAQQAVVSRGTVSLVLNQTITRVPISQETQERVIKAAQELGYAPNPIAQMLARGRNYIIGFFTFDAAFPYTSADFYNPYLVGVEREAGLQGYNILLFTRNQATTPREIYQDWMNSLLLADGVILTGNYPDSTVLRQLVKENYPCVLLGTCDISKNEIDSLESDHEPASYEATRHLLELGHRHLGFLVEDLSLSHHRERLAGSKRAVNETSKAYLTQLARQNLTTAEALKAALNQDNLTALICADRRLFRPLINLLQEIPLKIPDDLSLVFLSDTQGLPFTNPTRVRLNRDKVGQLAVQRLVKRLEGALEGYQQIRVPCDFLVGDTTGPLVLREE
jgi:DNA-binding LacI/PurR family transcriptional regulator